MAIDNKDFMCINCKPQINMIWYAIR